MGMSLQLKPSLIARQSSGLLDPFFELHHQCTA